MRSHINEDIVSSLTENVLSQSVLENTLVDFDHHSMTYPTPVTDEHLDAHVVSRRFGVEQTKEKEGVEYTTTRVVDHESESFKNSTVHSNEAPKHDTLDRFMDDQMVFDVEFDSTDVERRHQQSIQEVASVH